MSTLIEAAKVAGLTAFFIGLVALVYVYLWLLS